MENLNIQNTTAYLVGKGDRFNRTTPPKKVKLRPASKGGISENLGKFPEKQVQEVATTEPIGQSGINESVSEIANASNLAVSPDLQPPATTDGVKEEISVPKINSKLDGLTFYDLKGKVTPVVDSLPKGLKLKDAKKVAMLGNIPELISTPVAVVESPKEEVEPEEDQFQTVELELPERTDMSSLSDATSDSDMEDTSLDSGTDGLSFDSDDFMKSIHDITDSEEAQDDMVEIETEPIFVVRHRPTYSFESEEPVDTISNSSRMNLNSGREKSEKKKEAVPIYELCEAIDTQRLKTKEAEAKADRLSKDFQAYKEKSQAEIDASYREVKDAGDSQSEAESRYQAAEQEHRTALQNLMDTGKNQQRMLKQRQKDADDLIKKVVAEREKLELTNNTTLSQNQVQLQKYLSRTIDLNTKAQEKREEAAKWDAIARAMEDPEEDLMGYINPDDVYGKETAASKSYGRVA